MILMRMFVGKNCHEFMNYKFIRKIASIICLSGNISRKTTNTFETLSE
jgi:hypothetical protein